MTTVKQATEAFIAMVTDTREPNTALSYRKTLSQFLSGLDQNRPIQTITESMIIKYIDSLGDCRGTTVQARTSALKRFAEFAAAEYKNHHINLPRLVEMLRQRRRRPGRPLPKFPRDEIRALLDYVPPAGQDEVQRLRDSRDRAFLITLADTGLRVHEACNLRRGDMNFIEKTARVKGKGKKDAVVLFHQESIDAIQDYLRLRAELDGQTGKPLATLPIFARHDNKGQGKTLPMTPTTGRNIVTDRSNEALGEGHSNITPHSFRHYFVTNILRSTQNLKLAQELARHSNIAVTERYAHLEDSELRAGFESIEA